MTARAELIARLVLKASFGGDAGRDFMEAAAALEAMQSEIAGLETNHETYVRLAEAEIGRLRAQVERLDKAWNAGYLAGFNASGEGWNGEYPFGDSNEDPEADEHWIERRDAASEGTP